MWKLKNHTGAIGGEGVNLCGLFEIIIAHSEFFRKFSTGVCEEKTGGFFLFKKWANKNENHLGILKKWLTKRLFIGYTITLRVFAFFRGLPVPNSTAKPHTLFLVKRRGNRWKEPISPKNCIERKFMASAKEWKPPTAGKFSREDVTKAERDWPTDFHGIKLGRLFALKDWAGFPGFLS